MHHIVAKNEPLAKRSVDILLKYEIDIDSACNGVLLPGGSKTNDYSWVIDEANHFGGHSDEYLKKVNQILQDAVDDITENNYTNSEAQQYICQKLNEIRIKLLNGEIKIQNEETIK